MDSAGYAAFTLRHCSEYVLANRKQAESSVPADDGAKQEDGPQTGDTKDMTPWIVIAIIAGAAAAGGDPAAAAQGWKIKAAQAACRRAYA